MDGDFGLMYLLARAILFYSIALGLIGASIAFVLVIVVVTAVLILAGITTTSAFFAFWHRRISSGLIAFLTQFGAVAGMSGSIFAGLVLFFLFEPPADLGLAILFVGIGGLVIGGLGGLISGRILFHIYHWLAAHIKIPHRTPKQIFSQT